MNKHLKHTLSMRDKQSYTILPIPYCTSSMTVAAGFLAWLDVIQDFTAALQQAMFKPLNTKDC